jgi:Ca-activated chloride channel homolog
MARLFHKTSNSIRVLLIAILTLISCSRSFTKDEPEKPLLLGNCRDVITKNELGQTVILLNCSMGNIVVTVRDKQGAFKNDLSYEDFILKEDGRKQAISSFSREVDLPLTIGMIIDFSPIMEGVAEQLQEASRVLFKKMLRPKIDQMFMMELRDIERISKPVTFGGQIELVQDLTSDPEKIEKTANAIGGHNYFGDFLDAEFDTMLADSISYAATNKFMMLPHQSRKALIVLGSGYHVGNHLDLAFLTALEANTQIFAIHISDPNFGFSNTFGGGTAGLSTSKQNWAVYGANLRALSLRTGGSYFEYDGKKSFEAIFGEIAEALRSCYLLGYMPSDNKKSGCRKLDVSVKKEGLIVHAPESYCPPGTSESKKKSSTQK